MGGSGARLGPVSFAVLAPLLLPYWPRCFCRIGLGLIELFRDFVDAVKQVSGLVILIQ